MLATMTTKKPGKKPAAKGPRKTSKLTRAGDDAARLAKRTILLTTCEALRWNLSRVAEALELTTAADVIRALKELAPEEYEAAQVRGDITTHRKE